MIKRTYPEKIGQIREVFDVPVSYNFRGVFAASEAISESFP
jgi:hypothetical protein